MVDGTVVLTRDELAAMRREGRVCTDVALAESLAAGRLYLLDPANDGDAILDDLDDPEAIVAELAMVAGDELAEAHPGGPAAWGRARGWTVRRVVAIDSG